MTDLSVIVPFYNVAPYVAETLTSLRRSARPGIEFLLVDDGSSDETTSILAQRTESVPGARVITNSTNRGLSAARNVGVAEATGRYLTFLDGDDFVEAGYFPRLLATIERLGCDFVRTDHVRVNGRRRVVRRINHGPRGAVGSPRNAILPMHRPTSVDAPNAWAGIYHRRLADEGLLTFSEQLRTCEDRPWNWRLHLRGHTFAVVGLLGVFYRRGVSTSLTQLSDPRQFDFIKAYDQIVADVSADREADLLMPKAVWSYCAMICHHLNRADSYQASHAAELRQLCAEALDRLPADVLDTVVAGLGAARAELINGLRRS